MATTIFTKWWKDHLSDFPIAEEGDGHELGVTLFNRAPWLDDDATEDGWVLVEGLAELIDSPHWQAPGFFQNSVLAQVAEAASAEFYVQQVGNRKHVRLVDESSGFVVDNTLAVTATPVVALAIWYKGSLAGTTNPVIMLTRLDSPVLLQASEKYPATLKSLLFFSWLG